VIQLENIERVFQVGDQEVHALKDIELYIGQGEYVSIMGPSGSGKSTLLNIVGLLDRPSDGLYRLDGRDVTALTDKEQAHTRQKRIGFIFQFFHLVPRLTAFENVELPLVLAGVPPASRKPEVGRVLGAMGLGNRIHHRPDQLSGGQRQRVAIARATIMKPALLLADEPTGNLDRASGLEVLAILEELNTSGITLAVVTHDPDIGRRAARQIRMEDGRIVSNGAGI